MHLIENAKFDNLDISKCPDLLFHMYVIDRAWLGSLIFIGWFKFSERLSRHAKLQLN